MRLGALSMAVTLWLLRTGGVLAFPLIDLHQSGSGAARYGTRGAGRAGPAASIADCQWTGGAGRAAVGRLCPRIDFQELLTDNVEEQHSPRQADLVSYFAPGFSLAGDLPPLAGLVELCSDAGDLYANRLAGFGD